MTPPRKKRERQSEPTLPSPDDMTFEQAIEELESIVEKIEQGAIGLEEALAQRRRGDALIKRCRAILDTAEQELKTVRAGEVEHVDPDELNQED